MTYKKIYPRPAGQNSRPGAASSALEVLSKLQDIYDQYCGIPGTGKLISSEANSLVEKLDLLADAFGKAKATTSATGLLGDAAAPRSAAAAAPATQPPRSLSDAQWLAAGQAVFGYVRNADEAKKRFYQSGVKMPGIEAKAEVTGTARIARSLQQHAADDWLAQNGF